MANTARPVVCSDGRRFPSVAEAAENVGMSCAGITAAIQRRNRTRQGLKFYYADEIEEDDWNQRIETSARRVTAFVLKELKSLEMDSHGRLTETMMSTLRHQCKLLTVTLRRAKTPTMR